MKPPGRRKSFFDFLLTTISRACISSNPHPLAAQCDLRVCSPLFFAIGEEIGAAQLALGDHRMALPFPANRIRHFAAQAALLAEHDPASVPPQPGDSGFHQLWVRHK
jgi:hypothetical protein